MPGPRERILVFRSGRHLHVAMTALRADSPDCDISVVATPGSVAALREAGVPEDRSVLYDRTPSFRPLAFLTSRAAVLLLTPRFDRVCVLWNDPIGTGMANVDRTALVVSPRGFTAITPDGQFIVRRTWPVLRGEAWRALRSMAVVAGLGLLVFLPARILRPFRT